MIQRFIVIGLLSGSFLSYRPDVASVRPEGSQAALFNQETLSPRATHMRSECTVCSQEARRESAALVAAGLTHDKLPDYLTGLWRLNLPESGMRTWIDVKPLIKRGWLVVWRIDEFLSIPFVITPAMSPLEALRDLRDKVHREIVARERFHVTTEDPMSFQRGDDGVYLNEVVDRVLPHAKRLSRWQKITQLFHRHTNRNSSVIAVSLPGDEPQWVLVRRVNTVVEAVRKAIRGRPDLKKRWFETYLFRDDVRVIGQSGSFVKDYHQIGRSNDHQLLRAVVLPAVKPISTPSRVGSAFLIRQNLDYYAAAPVFERNGMLFDSLGDLIKRTPARDMIVIDLNLSEEAHLHLKFTGEDWALLEMSGLAKNPEKLLETILPERVFHNLTLALQGKTFFIKIVPASPQVFGLDPSSPDCAYMNVALIALNRYYKYTSLSAASPAVFRAYLGMALASIFTDAAGMPAFSGKNTLNDYLEKNWIRPHHHLRIMSHLIQGLPNAPQEQAGTYLDYEEARRRIGEARTLAEALEIGRALAKERVEPLSLAAFYFDQRYDVDLEIVSSKERAAQYGDGEGKPIIPIDRHATSLSKLWGRLMEWDEAFSAYPQSVARRNPLFRHLIIGQSGRAFHNYLSGTILQTLDDLSPESTARHELGHGVDPQSLLEAFNSQLKWDDAENSNMFASISGEKLKRFWEHTSAGLHGQRFPGWTPSSVRSQLELLTQLVSQEYEARRTWWVLLNRSSAYYDRQLKDSGADLWETFRENLRVEREQVQTMPFMDRLAVPDLLTAYDLAIERIAQEQSAAAGRTERNQLRAALTSRIRTILNPPSARVQGLSQIYSYEVPEKDNFQIIKDPDTEVRLRQSFAEWWAEQVKLYLSDAARLERMDPQSYELLSILLEHVFQLPDTRPPSGHDGLSRPIVSAA